MLNISPGPIPKDGVGVTPDVDLPAAVNGTEVNNFDQTHFVNTWSPFLFSQTDAPASNIRRPGTMWYKRGEGRLYIWNTQLPIVSSAVIDGFLVEGEPGYGWQCVSDRKEIYCRMINPSSLAKNRDFRGYGVGLLRWGMSEPDVRWTLGGNNPKFLTPNLLPQLGTRENVKYFVSNTNYTVAQDHIAGLMCYDIGYCRAQVSSTAYTGPGYANCNDDDFITQATINPFKDAIGQDRFPAHVCESGSADVNGNMLIFLFNVSPRTAWS